MLCEQFHCMTEAPDKVSDLLRCAHVHIHNLKVPLCAGGAE